MADSDIKLTDGSQKTSKPVALTQKPNKAIDNKPVRTPEKVKIASLPSTTNSTPNSAKTYTPSNKAGNDTVFNARKFWPDMIRTPTNSWIFTSEQIISRLGTESLVIQETKRIMEKCLLYFYNMKKMLNLFDHTYTASCILFYRYWFVFGLPKSIEDCICLSQSILVTACKGTENNRPIEVYVKATCEFIGREISGNKIMNVDKLKWDLRDKLVENEKMVLCAFGFDLDIENPKEMVEEMFSSFHRYTRDYNLEEDFKKLLPKILQESRNFIVQAATQPTCLLCDGYTFVALSLVYCGLQYKKMFDPNFKYPTSFFENKFPKAIDTELLHKLFIEYHNLEKNFFDLKSNKGERLEISKQEIDDIIQDNFTDSKETADWNNQFDEVLSGEVRQEFLDHTEAKVNELFEKMKAESNKRHLEKKELTLQNKRQKS